MKIVVAPDSFKGSLTAKQAGAAIKAGALRALPEAQITCIPLADGGEGTLEALATANELSLKTTRVQGPMGQPVQANWAIAPDGRAFIEMAKASGLGLVAPDRRDALAASSFGTGQLIKAALNAGCRQIVVGLGGSATSDGGIGALSALGLFARDAHARILPPGGGALANLASIDLKFFDARLSKTQLTLLCDVSNPLYGPKGAAHIYAPQKGATPAQVAILDEGLTNLSEIIAKTTGQNKSHVEGAGAAGGLGFGLMAFCDHVELRSGIDFVLESVKFSREIKNADLILTGEGAIDEQSLNGKVIAGVCKAALDQAIPVIGFAGRVELDQKQAQMLGLQAAIAITGKGNINENDFSNAESLLKTCVENYLNTL